LKGRFVMKIRQQFVSNSSSSNFCIFGIETTTDVIKTLFPHAFDTKIMVGCNHKFDRTTQKFCGECGQSAYKECQGNVHTFANSLMDGCIAKPGYYDEYFIGIDVQSKPLTKELQQNLEAFDTLIEQKFGQRCCFLIKE